MAIGNVNQKVINAGTNLKPDTIAHSIQILKPSPGRSRTLQCCLEAGKSGEYIPHNSLLIQKIFVQSGKYFLLYNNIYITIKLSSVMQLFIIC